MRNRYYIQLALILFILILPLNSVKKAQEIDSLYKVSIEIGVGYTRYITYLPQVGLNKNSFNITSRIMWQPEHLLSVGLETGYVPLYNIKRDDFISEFGSTSLELSLVSYPILLTFGMEIFDNFKVYGGIGGTILNSTADFFDNKVVSSSWSNTYKLAAAYLFNITENISIGGEIKWYNLSKIEDSALMLQIGFSYILISY